MNWPPAFRLPTRFAKFLNGNCHFTLRGNSFVSSPSLCPQNRYGFYREQPFQTMLCPLGLVCSKKIGKQGFFLLCKEQNKMLDRKHSTHIFTQGWERGCCSFIAYTVAFNITGWCQSRQMVSLWLSLAIYVNTDFKLAFLLMFKVRWLICDPGISGRCITLHLDTVRKVILQAAIVYSF